MIDSPTIDAWESFAKEHDVDYGSGNPLHVIASRQLQIISELRKLQEREAAFREALSHSDAAMTYAFEDHSDQYYLNVQKNIRDVLARFPDEKK